MKIASLSDIHLGYAGPGRIVGGRNGRSVDVENAWAHAVNAIVQEQPHLVSLAGDNFHSVTPSNFAIKAFQDGIGCILRESPATRIVVIPGNHCGPRTASALSPNALVGGGGRVHYIDTDRRIYLETGGERVAIDCRPFSALGRDVTYEVEPAKDADVRMLLIHAALHSTAAPGALPHWYGPDGLDVGRAAEVYEVIAAGDYHEMTRLHPTRLAFFSGAIERTSSNIWQERDPKGFVVSDTTTNELRFVEIPTRPVHSYVYDQETLSAESLNEQLQLIAYAPASKDTLLRVVASCARAERDGIDWRLVRELKQRAFHFALSIDWVDIDSVALTHQDRQRRTLADDAREFFGTDDQLVRMCAFNYLGLTEKLAA